MGIHVSYERPEQPFGSDSQVEAGTTRVIIVHYLSTEAQALCNENHVGSLDLEGDARLSMGEMFTGKRR